MIGVVLDQDEAPSRLQVTPDQTQHRSFLCVKMKGVGHHDTIEWREVERLAKIGDNRVQHHGRKPRAHCPFLYPQGSCVLVHRIDHPTGSNEISEGQGKGSTARAQIGPDTAWPGDASLQ